MRTFHTLAEYVEHVESLPWREGDSDERSSWCSTTHAEAVDLATHGWPDGAKLATEKVEKIARRTISGTSKGLVTNVGYDVIGAAYDAGAVALGLPEAWGVLQPEETKRAIRIVANIVVSGGVTEKAITERGLALTAIALVLQAEGFPVTVDIWTGLAARRGDWYEVDREKALGAHLVRIADAMSGSPLDVDRLTYALAHPSMFRKLNRSATQGYRNGARHNSVWDASHVDSESRPKDEQTIDLYSGGVHLNQVERWVDGGEAWVMQEYLRQTGG